MTVVMEVALTVNATPAEALVALHDIRALMKKQPAHMSEEFMKNVHAGNVRAMGICLDGPQ